MYNTPISDIAVLCVDPVHKRCGEVAELLLHDWRESGQLMVRFADGQQQVFPDGLEKDDEWKPVESYYRHNNSIGRQWDKEHGSGPEGLKRRYLELKVGGLPNLIRNYLAVFGVPLQ